MSARSNADPEALTRMLPNWAELIDTLPAEIFSWRFGDTVLTRAAGSVMAAREWRFCPRSRPNKRCVALACSRSDRGVYSTLVVAPNETLNLNSLLAPFDIYAPACEVLILFLPKDHSFEGGGERVRRLDTAAGPGALLAGYIKQLARQLPHIPHEQAEGLSTATRIFVDACLSPVVDRSSEIAPPPSVSALIERTRLVIHQNMTSPEFGPKHLVRLLGISRSKLYRLLDSAGGVASFINRERLTEAHRRLSTSSYAVSIQTIGNAVGFRDHSSFSRAFRREFGYSPTEARERALAGYARLPA